MKQLLIGLALLSVVLPANARLGDTWDQCVARYEAPVKDLHLGKIGGSEEIFDRFAKHGLFIDITFLDGKSESEVFRKFDGSPLTDVEQAGLLQANSGAGKWVREWDLGKNDVWTRDDGAVAGYQRVDGSLAIFSKKYSDAVNSKAVAHLKAELEGF